MGATESKLEFRKSVFRLYEEQDIPLSEDSYWISFFELADSPEDVFNLFSPKDIRNLRANAFSNMKSLVLKCYECFKKFLYPDNFPNQTISPKMVLNAIRILTRLFPFIYELPDKTNIQEWLWDKNVDIPLGNELITSIVRLMFAKQFTVTSTGNDDSQRQPKSRIHYSIWYAGIGASSAPTVTKEITNNRIEIVRLLLTILSEPMYIPHAEVLDYECPWTEVMCHPKYLEKKALLSLLCSLTNTVLSYDPIGWSILPYNHVLFTDLSDKLATLSCQLLVILLESKGTVHERRSSIASLSPSATSQNLSEGTSPDASFSNLSNLESKTQSIAELDTFNEFSYYLSKIHRSQDFEFLVKGFKTLLLYPMQSNNTILPGSVKYIDLASEVFSLFWKMIHINDKFMQYLLTKCVTVTNELVSALMYTIFSIKSDISRIATARLASSILQKLSEDRSFGIALNQPFDTSSMAPLLKFIPYFTIGSYADFYIISIYTLITSTQRSPLQTLHETLFISLANTSPYIKTIQTRTGNKLVSLLTGFSSPYFLMSKEANHKMLFYLMDTLNNMIQHQTAGNTKLIYSVLRNKDKVHALADLDYQSAKKEYDRIRLGKYKGGDGSTGQVNVSQEPINNQSDTNVNSSEHHVHSESSSNNEDENGKQKVEETAPLNDDKLRQQQEQQTPVNDNIEENLGEDHQQDLSCMVNQTSLDELTSPPPRISGKDKGKTPIYRLDSSKKNNLSEATINDSETVSKNTITADTHVVQQHRRQSAIDPVAGQFTPLESWFTFWKSQLPIQVLLALVDALSEQMEAHCIENEINDDKTALEFLESGTLVGLLPTPSPIFVRRVWGVEAHNRCIRIWFITFFWGVVYLKNSGHGDSPEAAKICPPLWNGTQIKLFQIRMSV